MKELVICQGLPASGKTTYARQWVEDDPKNRVRVNRDDIRNMLGPYWVPSREDLITHVENIIIQQALLNRYSVIVDATNLRGTQRFWSLLVDVNTKRQTAKEELVELTKQDFTDVPLGVCIKRDQERPNSVGEDVILRMYNQYLGDFQNLIKQANNLLGYNLEFVIGDRIVIESPESKPPEQERIYKVFDDMHQTEQWLKNFINEYK